MLLARLLDGSRFEEFKAGYGTTLVTGGWVGERVGLLFKLVGRRGGVGRFVWVHYDAVQGMGGREWEEVCP